MTIFGPYPATVVNVHDGDTVTLAIDLGFDITATERCRLYGINAPELSTQAGKDALTFAQTKLHPGDKVSVQSNGWDKYGGRFDGIIRLANGEDFASAMLITGHAVQYP